MWLLAQAEYILKWKKNLNQTKTHTPQLTYMYLSKCLGKQMLSATKHWET